MELLVANTDTMTLDSTNNVLVGPGSYFKVVIDSFDGKVIKAWHLEDSKGTKTENLAASASGKHIDVLVSKGNATVNDLLQPLMDRIYAEWDANKTELNKLKPPAQ
jgi:UDP-N-acetylenolpyruvoylglucosamine reductase